MRNADWITVARIALILPIVYLVLLKVNPAAPITLLFVSITLDGLDGFAAMHSASKGTIGFLDYLGYNLGDKGNARRIGVLKAEIGRSSKHGARFDIAGDRITEYSLWGLFTYVHILPFIVLIIIIMRHSIADALMGAKGTSSKMKMRFAKTVYSNAFGRAASAVLKFITFSYLMLVYALNYPVNIGYGLVIVLIAYILVRGAAEICESLGRRPKHA